MELIEQQRLLARLYTDADSRRAEFANALGVSGADADKLSAEVEFFARSLQRKRLKAVAKLLPATREAMGKVFIEYFFQYSRNPIPPCGDAVGFVRFLEHEARTEHLETARFEASRLEASKRRMLVRYFRLPKPTLAVWFRFSRGPLREWVLGFRPAP